VESAEPNIKPQSQLLKKLIDGLESGDKFQHLRIILSSKNNRSFRQKFLMVSPSAFGVVKLLDFNVENNHIYFLLQDIITGIVNKICIDVDDESFKFLLINWNDILTMHNQTNEDEGNDETLLDFDY
jgi:hypothetical protein